jgi:prolyl oligopeptidase
MITTKKIRVLLLLSLVHLYACAHGSLSEQTWLEDSQSQQVQSWVLKQNQKTLTRLQEDIRFSIITKDLTSLYGAEDNLINGSIHNNDFYHFLQDKDHKKGIWRRTPFDKFKSGAFEWETILDVDKLAADEDKNWVMSGSHGGMVCRLPEFDRCLISLSLGGGDVRFLREFDLTSKTFVIDGFYVPNFKSVASWIDRDTIFVGADWGEESQTHVKRPRQVCIWKRGTSLDQARLVFEGQKDDFELIGKKFITSKKNYFIVQRNTGLFSVEHYLAKECSFEMGSTCGPFKRLNMPTEIGYYDFYTAAFGFDRIIVSLRKDWISAGYTYKAGSVLAFKIDQENVIPEVLFFADPKKNVLDVKLSQQYIYIAVLDNIRTKILALTLGPSDTWHTEQLPLPENVHAYMNSVDPVENQMTIGTEGYLQAPSLQLVQMKNQDFEIATLQTKPAKFASHELEEIRLEVTSRDGTKIPFTIIGRKGLNLNGKHPTILYGYGGFQIPLLPFYLETYGKAWLEKGGLFVHAHVRGGGEFGATWANAVKKSKKQNSIDDFTAIAEDLIAKGYTSPKHLGIMGRSGGGLLVSAAAVPRPELFHAVVAVAPLIDMLRFHKVPDGGNAWKEEFGDPEIKDVQEYLLKYSPLHNIKPAKEYPEFLFITSSNDDRVHPSHARKMAFQLEEVESPVLLYEQQEGGHAVSTNINQNAFNQSLILTFLTQKLF